MKPRHRISALLCVVFLLFPWIAHSHYPHPIGFDEQTRTLSLDEVAALVDRGDVGEHVYLRGAFRVTASGPSMVVLRDAKRPNNQSPRVIVVYSAGDVPPKEGENFVRGGSNPYWVRNVRRGPDGVITIYVREISAADVRKL